MIGVIGLAFLLAPMQISNGAMVSGVMRADIQQTRTNEENEEVEFVSTVSEMSKEVVVEEKEYIGKFTITHYCPCARCNYPYGGMPAANGEPLEVGYTVAVDPKVISLNSMIEIDGYGIRKAQDTGGRIKKNKIDVLVTDHNKAYELGVKKNVDVYIIKE